MLKKGNMVFRLLFCFTIFTAINLNTQILNAQEDKANKAFESTGDDFDCASCKEKWGTGEEFKRAQEKNFVPNLDKFFASPGSQINFALRFADVDRVIFKGDCPGEITNEWLPRDCPGYRVVFKITKGKANASFSNGENQFETGAHRVQVSNYIYGQPVTDNERGIYENNPVLLILDNPNWGGSDIVVVASIIDEGIPPQTNNKVKGTCQDKGFLPAYTWRVGRAVGSPKVLKQTPNNPPDTDWTWMVRSGERLIPYKYEAFEECTAVPPLKNYGGQLIRETLEGDGVGFDLNDLTEAWKNQNNVNGNFSIALRALFPPDGTLSAQEASFSISIGNQFTDSHGVSISIPASDIETVFIPTAYNDENNIRVSYTVTQTYRNAQNEILSTNSIYRQFSLVGNSGVRDWHIKKVHVLCNQ